MKVLKRIKWGAVLFNLIMALFMGVAGQAVGLNAYAVAGTVFTAGMVMPKEMKAVLPMAVQVEMWQSDFVENLFSDNPFMNYAFNGDEYVLKGKVVHIPVIGNKPTVVKNNTSWPLSVSQRADSDILYAIDVYSTEPIHIVDADKVELSYDKRQSVIEEHSAAINESAGDWMLRDWFSKTVNGDTVTGQIIRTTGGADATAVVAHLGSATGNRLKFVKADLKAASVLMNKAKISKKDRYAIFDSEMISQLQDDPDLIKRDGVNGGEVNLKEGVIMKLYGFNIMERAEVLRFTNAATPVVKDPGAAGAATDNAGVLCWQKNCVEKALGEVKFFENVDDATYQGDVYSALLRVGGRIRRAAGVVAIVQAATS